MAQRLLSIIALLVLPCAMRAGNLTVEFRHLYNGKPLQLDAVVSNSVSEQIAISRCAYLLSEPSLKSRSDGQWLTSRNWFAFVNAANGEEAKVLDNLPPEKFNALRFHIGLDATTDKADPSKYPARHPLNPNVNGLHWGWAGGFVFLALEGHLAT